MKRGRPFEKQEGTEKVLEARKTNCCTKVEERAVAKLNNIIAELADQRANSRQKQTKVAWGLSVLTPGIMFPSEKTKKLC